MFAESRVMQRAHTQRQIDGDGIIAGIWLAFYFLAIVSAATSPVLISVAAQHW